MKKYNKYKPSGIKWIGDIPEHWKSLSFRFWLDVLTDFTANGSFASLAENVNYLDKGFSRLVRLTDLRVNFKNDGIFVDEHAHNFLKKSELFGDEILIANVGAYAGLVCMMPATNKKMTLGPNMFMVRTNVYNKYAYYLLSSNVCSEQLELYSISSAQPKLNKDNIRELKVIEPSIEEQTQIAAYLDQKTTQIDQTITQKEKLIELFEEEKKVMINQAVTKGLHQNVKLKTSGIEWLGDIPEHWDVKKLRLICYMKGRIGWQGLKQNEFNFNKELPYLITGMNFKNGYIRWEEVYHISEERYDEAPEIQLKDNDVLLTKDGTIGKLLYVDNIPYPHKASLNSHLLLLRPLSTDFISMFLYYQLDTRYFHDYVETAKTGTTFFGITQEAMGKFKMLLPPQKEQSEIIQHIEEQSERINNSITKAKKEIELIKEYRQALIFEAVTGKIDVREEVL